MKTLIVFLFIFMHAATSFGQQKDTTLVKNQNEWTTGTSHDFGTIKWNSIVSFTFEFINRGNQSVTIIKAQPGCSCTVSDYSKEPVAQGEKGIVKATFDANKPGKFLKTITVKTDRDEIVILKISGEVIQ